MSWDDPAEQMGGVLNIEELQPTEAQQGAMLLMARRAIAAALNKEPTPLFEAVDPFMSYRAGVFVTLRERRRFREGGPGQLRGCIGHMQADLPLRQVVPEMAIQAATGDPRFPPMKPAELKQVKIEIAILSPFIPVERKGDIVVGKHGLVLTGDWHRALLLPKSPVNYGWDVDQYLANLHRKAGLPPGYWPEQGKMLAFTSFDFGE